MLLSVDQWMLAVIRQKRFKMLLGVILLSGVAIFVWYIFGGSMSEKNQFYRKILYPTISQQQITPTQSLIPSISVQKSAGLQKCLDESAMQRANAYKEFCDRWEQEHGGEGCPGWDEISDPYQECYKKFGYPTATPARLLFRGTPETVTCPVGYTKLCAMGMCECLKL